MKKRYEEVSQNLMSIREALGAAGVSVEVHAKQLYHDREEITVPCAACGRRCRAGATSAINRVKPDEGRCLQRPYGIGRRSCCRLPSSDRSVRSVATCLLT